MSTGGFLSTEVKEPVLEDDRSLLDSTRLRENGSITYSPCDFIALCLIKNRSNFIIGKGILQNNCSLAVLNATKCGMKHRQCCVVAWSGDLMLQCDMEQRLNILVWHVVWRCPLPIYPNRKYEHKPLFWAYFSL
jgi:hypothetical protein